MNETLQRYSMYVDGRWVPPASAEHFESVDPYTTRPWCLVPRGTAADVDRAVEAAARAFGEGDWPRLHGSERGALLRKLGDLLSEDAERLATIEVRDNGKLISEALGQISYLRRWYHYFAGLAEQIEGAVLPLDKPALAFTRREPLGVVAAFVPWNSPLFLATWKLAPALAAGNTVILKPSEYASASILEMMHLVERAGFPRGVVNVLTGYGPEVGEPLATHPKVDKIAFTGSDQTGAHVYGLAARSIKPVTLELGGKSAHILFRDANLERAIPGAIAGIFSAAGQSCMAGSRLLVHEAVHDEVVAELVRIAQRARMGNPLHRDTQIGPLANEPQYEKVLRYVDVGKGDGALLVSGGRSAKGKACGDGWFVEPTIFTHVRNGMRIAQEEVFGPVLSVLRFREDEEAVAIANDSRYGLAAGIWTGDIRRAITVSERLRAGTVWVNAYRAISYLAPFGGYRRSGIGRENGRQALDEYLQTKTVWFSTSTKPVDPFVLG